MRRGDGELRQKRLTALLALPECVLVHQRSADPTYIDDPSDREALFVRGRPYLFGGTDRECFTHVAAAEFSDETGRRAVVFKEFC